MHFLFLYPRLDNLGGIETLIARMSDWLIEDGHTVTLLLESSGVEKRLMPPGLAVVEAGKEWSCLSRRRSAKASWSRLGLPAPDVIKSFEAECSWMGTMLSMVIRPTPRLVIGDYGPGFVPDRRVPFRNPLYRIFVRNIANHVPPCGRMFMSNEQLKEFQGTYGLQQQGHVWYLPVDGRRFADLKRAPRPGHLVSIGRLDPMKEYNLYMIDVVRRLVDRGFDVTWSVYGDGSFAELMRQRIADASLKDRVRLMGRLSYDRMGEVLANAFAFVGMGTAVIEASLCRVPGVVAMGHDATGVTYGPVYKFPVGNVGEFMALPPSSTVEAELVRLLTMSPGEYDREMESVYQYANQYSPDVQMERFLDICRKASPVRSSAVLIASHDAVQCARRLWARIKKMKPSGVRRSNSSRRMTHG